MGVCVIPEEVRKGGISIFISGIANHFMAYHFPFLIAISAGAGESGKSTFVKQMR